MSGKDNNETKRLNYCRGEAMGISDLFINISSSCTISHQYHVKTLPVELSRLAIGDYTIIQGSFTWVSLLCKSNDVFTINIVLLWKE